MYHCIIHLEALCAQTFPTEIQEGMDLVVKIVNQIVAKALNHCWQFCSLFDEVNNQNSDFSYNKVQGCPEGGGSNAYSISTHFYLQKPEVKSTKLFKNWFQKFNFTIDMKLQGWEILHICFLKSIVCICSGYYK